MFATHNDRIDHFRWPFCRTYPTNPELTEPPIFYTYVDPDTKQSSERERYKPLYSYYTQAQKDADEKFGNILKVVGVFFAGSGLMVLGYYLASN